MVKKNETTPNKAKIDFNDMESLFCQQAPVQANSASSANSAQSANSANSANMDDQRKKQKDEVGGFFSLSFETPPHKHPSLVVFVDAQWDFA